MLRKLSMLLTVLLLVSCGEESSSGVAEGPSADRSAPMLRVTGEIGVELGDSNYVFGIIQAVDLAPDGTVAVLDGQKKRVRVYTPEGLFIGSFGGEGEAPGEFLNPQSLACLEDGRIAVSDPFSREVEIFNHDFSYSETVADFTERAPFVITATDRGFAGEQGGFNRDEGTVTQKVVSWDLERDSVSVLMEHEEDFSQENMAVRFMQPQAGITSGGGMLYFSPPETDEYLVHVFPLDGSQAEPLIYPGYSPVQRTQEDIQEERQEYDDRLQAMAASGRGGRLAGMEYEPPRYHYATASLGIDAQGRIWVQRGWEPVPVFDIFMPGETVPSETVNTDPADGLSGCDFVITPYGMVAFERDPEYYPRVFLLELQE